MIQRRAPVAGDAELLAHHAVARPGRGERVAHRVSTAWSASVTGVRSGLVLNDEVAGAEPRGRDRVGGVGERVREFEVGVEAGDARNVVRAPGQPLSAATRPTAAIVCRSPSASCWRCFGVSFALECRPSHV